jgi:type I restriction enzyme S subunit
MKPETFFDNFEVLAEAPNGVQKLRELILQMAVRGKLVAQDVKDESANNLLKRIKTKKEQLIKENKIKKIEPLAPINKTEVPYILPVGWDWAHFGDFILSITGGGTPSKNNPQFWNGNIPWASVKDLGKSKYLETTIDFITEKGIQNSSTNLIPKGRVIICTRMGLGKIALNKIDVAINQDLKAIELPEEFNENYFYNFYITQNIKGSGMTVSGIRQTELLNMLVPVPPFAEQHRIVTKVDQLMSLCDELEARQQKKRETRAHLNSAALDRLLAARAPGEFAQGWRRIYDNFELLYDVPENVGELRKAILQLAVIGKLVEQDSNDEQASVLREKIKAEKEWLVKEKKIRKSEILSPILADEIQHDLPENWTWIRLADICELITDGTHQTPNYTNNGRIFLSAQNVKPFRFMPENCRYVSEEDYQEYVKNRKAQFEDILLTRVGAGIGEAAVIDKKMDFAFYVSIGLIRPMKMFIDPYYLTIFLNSPIGTEKSKINTYGKGVSQGNLNLGLIKKFIVPIPPINEQRRIVARVD